MKKGKVALFRENLNQDVNLTLGAKLHILRLNPCCAPHPTYIALIVTS